MKVGIDLDGVLATWDVAFAKLLFAGTGRSCPVMFGDEPPMWEWPEQYGYSEEEIQAAWARVSEVHGFWRDLPRMADVDEASLRAFHAKHEVYFITARRNAKEETARWLTGELGLYYPSVICSRNKGQLAKALQLSSFIDDMPEMCLDVAAHSPKTRTYLRVRKHNEAFHRDCTKAGVRLAKDLSTFLSCETHNAK
jgi:hypothetical protein